jgi:hypothetical protein
MFLHDTHDIKQKPWYSNYIIYITYKLFLIQYVIYIYVQ